jgi:phage repressor protein C with HTH and peptisase S24 domain
MSEKTTEVPIELRIKLAEYINDLKDKRNLGFNQLSLKSEVNPGVLTKILNGTNKRVNPYQLQKIAQALRIDYKELYRIVDYLEEDECKVKSNLDLNYKYKQIPLYSSISAGLGLDELEDEEVKFIAVPEIKQFSGDVVAVKVSGDSMQYTIENNSIIFIRKGVEVPNKKIGAFIYNNKAVLKRYFNNDGEVFLRSDNREYPDIILKDGDTLEMVGRFIGQINEDGE